MGAVRGIQLEDWRGGIKRNWRGILGQVKLPSGVGYRVTCQSYQLYDVCRPPQIAANDSRHL